MNVAVASDHAGALLHDAIVAELAGLGHAVTDTGKPNGPVDYPDAAAKVVTLIATGAVERAVLICGSGVGISVAANKAPGVRAAICHDSFSAHQGVEDDAMNVLCLGARVIGRELALELTNVFMKASFSGAPRHLRRLRKVEALERPGGSLAEVHLD